MSKRVLVLVEGQTEERFVKTVLVEHFSAFEVYLSPTILTTKRVKDGPDFKGGVRTFAKFENDVKRLLLGNGGALVTTMLDYYRLPSDFPGMSNRPGGSPQAKVAHVERELGRHFGSRSDFLPFLALHEFEAWLFSSPDVLPRVLTDTKKAAQFASICGSMPSPEDINERPEHAPSKRILSLFPAYKKTQPDKGPPGAHSPGYFRPICRLISSIVAISRRE